MRLVFALRAKREWQKLDTHIQKQLRKKLVVYLHADNPLHYAEKLKNSSWGDYRFRIGDYRIIFDVSGDAILVLKVGHRKDIYRT